MLISKTLLLYMHEQLQKPGRQINLNTYLNEWGFKELQGCLVSSYPCVL